MHVTHTMPCHFMSCHGLYCPVLSCQVSKLECRIDDEWWGLGFSNEIHPLDCTLHHSHRPLTHPLFGLNFTVEKISESLLDLLDTTTIIRLKTLNR
jgi:hypothetical protein